VAESKLIPLCRLYENVSKTSGKKYYVGNWTFTSKLLLLENRDAKEGEPQWTLYVAEREPKPQPRPRQDGQTAFDDIPNPADDEPVRRRRPYPDSREF
jgi:hypothetical protein